MSKVLDSIWNAVILALLYAFIIWAAAGKAYFHSGLSQVIWSAKVSLGLADSEYPPRPPTHTLF